MSPQWDCTGIIRHAAITAYTTQLLLISVQFRNLENLPHNRHRPMQSVVFAASAATFDAQLSYHLPSFFRCPNCIKSSSWCRPEKARSHMVIICDSGENELKDLDQTVWCSNCIKSNSRWFDPT